MKQFHTVFHSEHGKGHVMAVIPKAHNNVYMCYFPNSKTTEFVSHRQLVDDTDEFVSLQEREFDDAEVSDRLQHVLESLFSGGQPPHR